MLFRSSSAVLAQSTQPGACGFRFDMRASGNGADGAGFGANASGCGTNASGLGNSASGYGKALGLQALFAGGMAAVWAFFSGYNAGLSALLGGAICFLPSALFAWRLRSAARRGVGAFGVAFFGGEVVKLALSAVLFAAAIGWYRDVNVAALVVTYIVTLQAYLLALLIA